jgi:hypothetical protein
VPLAGDHRRHTLALSATTDGATTGSPFPSESHFGARRRIEPEARHIGQGPEFGSAVGRGKSGQRVLGLADQCLGCRHRLRRSRARKASDTAHRVGLGNALRRTL